VGAVACAALADRGAAGGAWGVGARGVWVGAGAGVGVGDRPCSRIPEERRLTRSRDRGSSARKYPL